MNIGIVTTWFPRGAAYVSRAYLETLAVKHAVFIYARGGERYAQKDPEWDKNYVTWGKRFIGKDGTYIDWEDFQKWIAQNQLDLILFNEQQNWEVVLKAIQLPIPIGSYVDYYTAQTVPFFRLYDFLFCNTRRHYRVFQNHPQAFYIPWGTDLNLFKPRKRDYAKEGITFFHSAGLSPDRKGTDILVKAFREVRGDSKLIIHTQSQRTLKKHSLAHRLITQDPRVELIEKEVEAPGLYHLGDVYVYPTRLEGIGLTIMEALASGLPVITTDAPPMNEFITQNINGKLVEAASVEDRPANYYWPRTVVDVDSLREAMQFFVDNPGQIGEFQEQARLSAEQNFNWKKNSENLPEMVTKLARLGARTDAALIKAVVQYEQSGYRFLKQMERAFRQFRKRWIRF
ncbi:MAG: glycosyltransferase family 4 protein [Candidatus Omnitrophica bacterium]|nr:glycosyltransferase family 4 protein [Candidatus Omnitrophota bacterium]